MEKPFGPPLRAWATFQTPQAKSRLNPGRLYYPNEFSRVFKKYLDYLPCLDQHPDFKSESKYTQQNMRLVSEALSSMLFDDTFEPRPAAEVKQVDIEISDEAAISRLRPIQDGLDYWQEHRSSPDTVSGGSAPGRSRQCSILPGRGSTRRDSRGSATICRCCRALNETVGCAFMRVPTRGSLTELKGPYGALARKCIFIHLVSKRDNPSTFLA
jgi:hypothetical protein